MPTATLITFIVYLLGMLLIGVMAYRLTNNLSDYVLGGRSLGPGVAAISAGASDMSSWLTPCVRIVVIGLREKYSELIEL